MLAPLVLFAASMAGVAVALILPAWSDLLLLAVPSALASLLILLWSSFRRAPAPKPKWILVDGSNVLYWLDGTPRIESVRDVVTHLAELGYAPGVMFDANAGYLTTGRYQDDRPFARLLGLPEDRVLVVPKGTPADPALLASARDLGAGIVTNDQYRDWAGTHPEVRAPGHLIRGGYRDGKLWLNLDPSGD